MGKNCRTEHPLWKKDQKKLKQRLNCSAQSRRTKSGFQRLHIPCVYTGSLALSSCPSHVPSSSSDFSLVFLSHGQGRIQLPGAHFELCLGSPAHGLSGQPEDKQNR